MSRDASLEPAHEAGERSIYGAMHELIHLYEKHNGRRPGMIRITHDQWARLRMDPRYAGEYGLTLAPSFDGIPLDITAPIDPPRGTTR